MSPFRRLARELLTDRARLVLGLVFAAVSAAGLSLGIVAVVPVLEAVLEPGSSRGLPELMRDLDASAAVGGRIPDAWIDALPPGPFTAVVAVLGLLGVLTLVGAAANFLHQYLALTVVFRTVARIRQRAYEHTLALPLRRLVASGAADPISRVINDTEALQAGFSSLLSKAVAQITKGIGAFIAALVINWQIALAASITAPLLAVVIRKLGKRIRRASRSALASRADLFRASTEAVQGLRVVKVHHTERLEAQRFDEINTEVLKQSLRVRTARALSSPLVEVISIFVLGSLTLIAVKLILDGYLEPAEFIGTLTALGIAGGSLRPLTGLVNDIQASAAAADRLCELLDDPGEPTAGRALSRHEREIVFERVALTYPGAETPALDGVSLSIPFGQTVAFVGPNGSGKTTLLSLVPRLIDPSRGRVLIDGQDLSTADLRDLRKQIGVVTQETVLFRRSVRDNVAYGIDASRERIDDALARAHASDIVAGIPGGLDAQIGEQGLTLSGGQRQRLAIARAILRDPAVLILDEATSMIDADSEARITEAIAEFSRGRTTLVVAHRLSTVVNADRIVVLDAGRIIDDGTHDELLERCELYRQLARHQLVRASGAKEAERAT
ncbi:MAG: ABC transporter ATP-binding protein [Planctomycetota bacterium]